MTKADKFDLILTELKTMALYMCAAPTDLNGVRLGATEANDLLDKVLLMNKKQGQTMLIALEGLRRFR